MMKMLGSLSTSAKWPLKPVVVCSAVVPDDSGMHSVTATLLRYFVLLSFFSLISTASFSPSFTSILSDKIAEMIKLWADIEKLDLILTSGGTGFGVRDNTPETVRPLLHREAPGVAQALINEGAARF